MIKSTILLLSPILSFLLSISGQNFWRQINPLGVGHRRPFIITNHWSYGLDDAGWDKTDEQDGPEQHGRTESVAC